MTHTSPTALVISTNNGTETEELVGTVSRLTDAGISVTVSAPEQAPIRTLVLDAQPGPEVTPDTELAAESAASYDALVIPGGTLNADALRVNSDAQRIAREFAESGKVIAAICHGPWLLAETALSSGRTLTSYSSIRTDLTNAGARWVDSEVVVDTADDYTVITSRTPDDIPAFAGAIVTALS